MEERRLLGTVADELYMALTPDGSRLAIASNPKDSASATIRLWDVAIGAPQQVVEVENRQVHSLAFSPDGHVLVAGTARPSRREQAILLLDPVTGEQRGTLPSQASYVRHLTFSADGRWLASSSGSGTVQVWDMATRSVHWVIRGGRRIGPLAFTQDGKYLAGGDTTGRVWFWNTASGAESLLIEVSNKWIWSLAFSPDGRTLATAAHHRPVQLWDISPLEMMKNE